MSPRPRSRSDRLPVGAVLEEAWTLYTRNSGRLIAMAAIVFGFLALVDALVDSAVGARWLFVPISVAVSVLGVFWLQGAVVVLVRELRGGRVAVPIPDLFRSVQPRLGALAAAGLLATVGIGIGLILFVVPGLVLLTLWSLLPPAIVLEQRGVRAAFSRSVGLVRGNGLRVFLVIVVTVVFATIVGLVITAILQPLPDFFDYYLAGLVANSVTVPFVALSWTLMYFELRSSR